MEAKFHEVFVVENGEQALEIIKNLVPKGATINNGGSMTLHEIGMQKKNCTRKKKNCKLLLNILLYINRIY